MNTSNRFIACIVILLLAISAWAQDDADSQDEGVPEEAVEALSEPEPEAVGASDAAAQDDATEETQSGTEEGEAEAQDAADEQDAGAEGGDIETQESADEQEAGAETGQTEAQEAAAEPAADAPAASESAAETFVFQGHPIFTPDQAQLVYQPLVNYLNDVLPYRFELETAPDYHRYWLSIRRGENPHLILEEPHLVSYRMERHGFTPLVRAEEPITYSLLTSVGNEDVNVRDFIGQRVSSMPAPSLGYLILANWFDNPMQQPIIQSNAASWLDAVEIVFSMEADAAIVPHNLVSRYVNMQNVLTSQEFPGVTIAASPAVPEDIQTEIREALLELHENEQHFAALNELDIDQFISAEASNYEDLDNWLSLVYSIL